MTDDLRRPLDRDELDALRANLADMTHPLDGWPKAADMLLATLDEERSFRKNALAARSEPGRPPLDPETLAHDDAYMAGLIRGRELEREARSEPPAEGLDVERLARAMVAAQAAPHTDEFVAKYREAWLQRNTERAREIAEWYDRLAPEQPE